MTQPLTPISGANANELGADRHGSRPPTVDDEVFIATFTADGEPGGLDTTSFGGRSALIEGLPAEVTLAFSWANHYWYEPHVHVRLDNGNWAAYEAATHIRFGDGWTSRETLCLLLMSCEIEPPPAYQRWILTPEEIERRDVAAHDKLNRVITGVDVDEAERRARRDGS